MHKPLSINEITQRGQKSNCWTQYWCSLQIITGTNFVYRHQRIASHLKCCKEDAKVVKANFLSWKSDKKLVIFKSHISYARIMHDEQQKLLPFLQFVECMHPFKMELIPDPNSRQYFGTPRSKLCKIFTCERTIIYNKTVWRLYDTVPGRWHNVINPNRISDVRSACTITFSQLILFGKHFEWVTSSSRVLAMSPDAKNHCMFWTPKWAEQNRIESQIDIRFIVCGEDGIVRMDLPELISIASRMRQIGAGTGHCDVFLVKVNR